MKAEARQMVRLKDRNITTIVWEGELVEIEHRHMVAYGRVKSILPTGLIIQRRDGSQEFIFYDVITRVTVVKNWPTEKDID